MERLDKLIEALKTFCEVEAAREVNTDSYHLWLLDQLETLKNKSNENNKIDKGRN